MKKEARGIYLILSNEIGAQLCVACKYGDFTGSSCCDDGYYECQHKLNDYIGFPLYKADGCMEPGMDCWGFRPDMKVEDLADITGVILEQGFDEWSFTRSKGKTKIYGRKPKKVVPNK